MAYKNEVNRILQQKINALSDKELFELADSYIGANGFLLLNGAFTYLSKIVDYDKDYTSISFDDQIRGRLSGDKTILFKLESKAELELVDFAVVGDTLNVKEKKGGGYSNLEITHINETMIVFSDARSFTFPITRKQMIYPMLMNIGWIENRSNAQNVSNVIAQPTKNYEGDFVSEFLQNNGKNLIELEKNNRPLFDVVEMTLNFLNQKFGSGKTATESVDNVIVNAEDIIQTVKEQSGLIGLVQIAVINNEGKVDLTDRDYNTWTAFNDDLKLIYEDTIGGYNKVRVKVLWEDGSYVVDRVDVGVDDFNPNVEKVGLYMDRPFYHEDKLKDEPEKYQWDDEIIVETTEGEVSDFTKEDIENEINALEVALMYEEDADNIQAINDKIEGLKISLTLI